MSSYPSLRHLYDFAGRVIQKVQVTQEIAVVKLHRDRRRNLYCPHCLGKAALKKNYETALLTYLNADSQFRGYDT